ncbi:formate--phosphoribosylaminoimidazolecarboxamide ligase [Candidatus Bathyarchaeota archaeon]|nr:formate--phosphoribosylaminoimidazolecarboxamide ligase [Candidatus Bathyarchaeota archaeon]
MKEEINEILKKYDRKKISIGTLGSHSALNIFKGAKEENLRTVCICKKDDEIVYKKFQLADEVIFVSQFQELLDEAIQEKLRELNTILIPHGSFTAYISAEEIMSRLLVPMFANRELLRWEVDREKQRKWLEMAGLNLPKTYKDPKEIEGLTIVKFPGARGGRGYFLVTSPKSFFEKAEDMMKRGHLTKEDLESVHLQEYIIGGHVYPHYFRSIMENDVEFLGVDKRYESTVDDIGRIPASEQLQIDLRPTYTIVGNIPITLRESLLPEILRMGDRVVEASMKISYPGIIGPFCLETVITDNLKIYTFEISARIVAGTNVGIGTSPYLYLKYGERMWMGRRIAREIKKAIQTDRLEEIVY